MNNLNKHVIRYNLICRRHLMAIAASAIVGGGMAFLLKGQVSIAHADSPSETLSSQSLNSDRTTGDLSVNSPSHTNTINNKSTDTESGTGNKINDNQIISTNDKSKTNNTSDIAITSSTDKNKTNMISGSNVIHDNDKNNNSNGILNTNHAKNVWFSQDNGSYYADSNGNTVKGLQNINSHQYYFDDTGKQVKGKIVNIDGKDMYFDDVSGTLVTNQDVTIDGNHYHADLNGKLIKRLSPSPESLMTNTAFNQNFHYNTPRGYSNDIQSIVPHKNINGKIDYYDVYYLYNPYPSYVGWADEWYHVTTKDFKTFTPYDKNNPTSLKNVAIPSPSIKNANGNSSQMMSNNKHVPWGYVATGSVINNNGLLKTDQWGKHIYKNAKLAYFTSFDAKQKIYLAYSNQDQQYHPYSNRPVMSLDMFKITDGGGDFRDVVVQRNPKNSKQLVAYIAGGWSRRFYVATSKNGVKWNYSAKNNINMVPPAGNYPFEVETPIVKTINGHTMLFYSWHGGDNRTSSYVTGKINKKGLFELTKDSKIQDVDGNPNKGDIYAGNYTNLDKHTLININWSGNWTYSPLGSPAYDSITKHSGSMALPRLIQYKNGHLVYIPIEPDNKLINSYRIDSSAQSILVNNNDKLDFTFDNPNKNKTIILKRSDSIITITVNSQGIRVIRHNNLNPVMDKDVTTPLSTKNVSKVELYVDNSSVEAYLPQANKSFNIVNYGSIKNEPYDLLVDGNVRIDDYEFKLASNDDYRKNRKQVSLLQNNIKNDIRLANKFRKNNKSLLSLLSRANEQLAVAKTNLKIVKRKGSDVRAGLYNTLATNSIQKVRELESQIASSIMKLSNAGKNVFNNDNGINIINGHQTWFINGKRKAGIIINGNYYDKQTGYLAKNTFYLSPKGSYYYFDRNGNMVKNMLVQSGDGTGVYYYFDSNGKAITGAKNINGSQYMFDNHRRMIRNDFVKNDNNTLSYYDNDGKLALTNFTVEGNNYTTNALGNIQGDNIFVQSPNNSQKFYYLQNNHVVTGMVNYSGKTYYFDNKGLPVTNNIISYDNNVKYYIGSNNQLVKNTFIDIGNDYYYFGNDGRAVVGSQTINGQKLYFNSNGVQVKGQFVKHANGSKSYYDADSGQLVTNQQRTVNGTKYSFDTNGIAKINHNKKIVNPKHSSKYKKVLTLVKNDSVKMKSVHLKLITVKRNLRKHNTRKKRVSYRKLSKKYNNLKKVISSANAYLYKYHNK